MNKQTQSFFACSLFAIVFFAAQASGDADDIRYRVAGIIEAESKSLAMIESSDGEQAVYRPGDAIGAGEIGSVSSDGVIVLLDGQTYLLPLQGEPTILRDLELSKAGHRMKFSAGVGQYEIDFDEARSVLLDANRPPDDMDDKNPDYKYSRISEALALPAGARVEAVDENAVGSAEHTILALVSGMNSDYLRIQVSGVPGVRRVYISGQPESQTDL